MSIPGLERPIQLMSGASAQQLKYLAAAFKLVPSPTAEQLGAIANRISLPVARLEPWFQSRRTLEKWIQMQRHLKPAELAVMFYEQQAAPQA